MDTKRYSTISAIRSIFFSRFWGTGLILKNTACIRLIPIYAPQQAVHRPYWVKKDMIIRAGLQSYLILDLTLIMSVFLPIVYHFVAGKASK